VHLLGLFARRGTRGEEKKGYYRGPTLIGEGNSDIAEGAIRGSLKRTPIHPPRKEHLKTKGRKCFRSGKKKSYILKKG